MKALFSFCCSLAVAAGIFMGFLDYRKELRDSQPAPESLPNSVGRVEGDAERGASRGKSGQEDSPNPARNPRNGPGDRDRPSSRTGVDEGESTHSTEERESAVPDGTSIGVDGALAADLETMRQKIEAQEFTGAASYGEEILAKSTRGGTREREELARLIAKCRAYERIIQALPESTAVSGVSQVVLANGNTVDAAKVDTSGDRYTIELARGGTFSPRKQDVLEVRPVKPEAYLTQARQRIEAKVEKAGHPIDWFLDGVQEYFALGLHKEGIQVLDRILALESDQSDQVPLLFVPDADDALLRDWQVASGRRPPDAGKEVATAHSPSASTEVHREPPATEPSDVGVPVEIVVDEPPLPRETVVSYPPRPSVGSSAMGSADTGELVRCAQLFAEAQMLYQGAARQEGKEGDLQKARGRLDRAMEIIEGQPSDDETVRRLRRQIGQLLSDVARASPF